MHGPRVLAVLCLALAGVLAWQPARSNPTEVYATSIPAVFALTAIDGSGRRSTASAFAVGPRAVLTSYHAVAGASRLILTSVDTGEVVAGVSLGATDSANDLALLDLAAPLDTFLPLRAGTPAIGERVLVIGSPAGLVGSLSDGLVAGFRRISGRSLVQITAPVDRGNSGGPVLDATGAVIGVVHARVSGRGDFGFATPLDEIRKLVSGVIPEPQAAVAANESAPLATEALSARTDDAEGRSLDAGRRGPPAAARDDAITIGLADWDSADATGFILAETLRQRAGVSVDFVADRLDALFARLEAGEVDVIADVWLPNHYGLVRQYGDGRGPAVLSRPIYNAIQGLCVTRHTQEELGLTRVSQLNDPEISAAFDRDRDGRGELWIGQPGWQSMYIELLKARDYGYGEYFDLIAGGEEEEWTAVLQDLTQRRHRVFFCYAPHWITGRSDIALLDEPAYEAGCFRFVRPQDDPAWFEKSVASCRAPRESVHLVVARELAGTNPMVFNLLSKGFSLPVGGVQEWLRGVKQQERRPLPYTRAWLERHEDLVIEWMDIAANP